jgi:hypothetical protein
MQTFLKFSAVFILLGLSTSLFAQSSASATAEVTAQLKRGLSITNLDGDLDFGEIILTGSPQTPAITPGSGVRFEVTGHPNKDVAITFSGVTLDNNAWVIANGGTNGTLAFTPDVEHTGSSPTYSGPVVVTTGDVVPLVNVTGTGYLYLWLGGSLAIAAAQPQGDYTGTFTMNVAY